MAWFDPGGGATSYVNGQFLEDALNNTVAFDLVQASTTTMKVALFKENITGQDPDAAETYGSGAYASTYEVGATGTYSLGGSALTGTTLTSASGVLTFDESDATMEWTGATWADGSAPIGAGIYDDNLTDRLICAIRFGANDIPVTSGTFTITWSGSGIFYATYYS